MSKGNGSRIVTETVSGEVLEMIDNGVPVKRTRKPIAAGLGVIRATLAEKTVNALTAKEESSKLDRNTVVETALICFLEIATPEQRKEALKRVRELHVKNEEDNI